MEYIFFLYNLAPTATCSSHKTHSPSVSISEQKLLCTPGYITTVPSETRQWYQSSFFQLICGCFLLLVQECAASCPTPTSCSPNSQLGHQSQQDSACWVTVAALQHLLTLFVWELWTLYHKNGGGNSACTFPGVFFFLPLPDWCEFWQGHHLSCCAHNNATPEFPIANINKHQNKLLHLKVIQSRLQANQFAS